MNLEKLIDQITNISSSNKLTLVCIDGKGGSGKSTLVEKLNKLLSNSQIIHLDWFPSTN